MCLGALIAAALSMAAAQSARTRPVASDTARSAPVDVAAQRLEAGRAAVEARDWAAAEAALRPLIEPGPPHAEACALLRELDGVPGIDPPADESAIAEVAALLGEGVRTHRTDHFVIVGNCSESWTQGRAHLLERTYHQFFKAMDRMGVPAAPPGHKLVCVLIRDHGQYQVFARAHDGMEARWAAGYYATAGNRVVFYDDSTSPSRMDAQARLQEWGASIEKARARAAELRKQGKQDQARALSAEADRVQKELDAEHARLRSATADASRTKTIHEAVHLIAYNCGVQSRARQYPFWFSEGLATTFETEEPDNAFGPWTGSAARDAEFAALLAAGEPGENAAVPLEALVAMNAAPADDSATASAMYATSYALMRVLARSRRDDLAAYIRAMWNEPAGMIGPRRHAEMFEQHFGDTRALWRRVAE